MSRLGTALAAAALATALHGVGVLPSTPTASASGTTPATAPTTVTPSGGPSAGPSITPTASASGPGTPAPSTTPGPATAHLTLPGTLAFPGAKPDLPWPKKGRARLEVPGVGVLGHSGPTVNPAPIASVTKAMTAYAVLRHHPLGTGQLGPKITVRKGEADSYARRLRAGESLVKVRSGERITERDALEGVLVRSGNNMADILARWDSGSVKAFVARMNRTAAALGMTSTHFVDADGLSPSSRSSTTDLLKLSRVAMADPTFATVVGLKKAEIPLNSLTNTNKLLGRNGVIGIKTGSTRAAGGCLLFAAVDDGADGDAEIHGVVMGAPGPRILTNAMDASERLVVAARKAVRPAVLIPAGTEVAELQDAAGQVVRLGVAQDVSVTGWGGLSYRLQLPAGLAPGQVPATAVLAAPDGATTIGLVPLDPT